MSEPNQSTPPAPGNDRTTADSSTVTSEKPSSIVSGGIGHDVELQRGVIENKEGASADEPPEGGLQAWIVVLGAWCCSFCCYGWINSECPNPEVNCC